MRQDKILTRTRQQHLTASVLQLKGISERGGPDFIIDIVNPAEYIKHISSAWNKNQLLCLKIFPGDNFDTRIGTNTTTVCPSFILILHPVKASWCHTKKNEIHAREKKRVQRKKNQNNNHPVECPRHRENVTFLYYSTSRLFVLNQQKTALFRLLS
jgi:hypothetical protein